MEVVARYRKESFCYRFLHPMQVGECQAYGLVKRPLRGKAQRPSALG